MRNDFKPAAFEPHSEDTKSVAFELGRQGGSFGSGSLERNTGSGKKQPFLGQERNRTLRPWQARKNRLASAAGKQDDSGVHHATAANGWQDVSVAPALLAGPGAMQEAVSQLRNYESTPSLGNRIMEEYLNYGVEQIKNQATIVAVALACVICGCGEKNAPPPVATPARTQPSPASPAAQPSIAEGISKKPVPVKLAAVSDLDTLMDRIPTNQFTLSDEGGWDKFTMPKVQKWVSENLYGNRARVLVAALDCNVAQDETDPKPDEWIVKLNVTGRHANYAGMGNRLLPISKEGERSQSSNEPLGEAAFVFKCTEAEARKWDAHGKNTPAPVTIEGDIVAISFTPRLVGLEGIINNTFLGYDTTVRLGNVAVVPSKDLEPVALLLPEVQSIREPLQAIIETKRLDSRGDYQLVYLKYWAWSEDNGQKLGQLEKHLKLELRSFPLVKDGQGFHAENGMLKGRTCSDPPTESEIVEAKANVGWPKSGQ